MKKNERDREMFNFDGIINPGTKVLSISEIERIVAEKRSVKKNYIDEFNEFDHSSRAFTSSIRQPF